MSCIRGGASVFLKLGVFFFPDFLEKAISEKTLDSKNGTFVP